MLQSVSIHLMPFMKTEYCTYLCTYLKGAREVFKMMKDHVGIELEFDLCPNEEVPGNNVYIKILRYDFKPL